MRYCARPAKNAKLRVAMMAYLWHTCARARLRVRHRTLGYWWGSRSLWRRVLRSIAMRSHTLTLVRTHTRVRNACTDLHRRTSRVKVLTHKESAVRASVLCVYSFYDSLVCSTKHEHMCAKTKARVPLPLCLV